MKCCEKCFDVYYDKTYPAHTSYEACTNRTCECHKETPAAVEKERPDLSMGMSELRCCDNGDLDEPHDCLKKPPPPAKEWWEEEFDEGSFHEHLDEENCVYYTDALKSFISRIAAQSEKKGREAAVDYIGNQLLWGGAMRREADSRLVKIVLDSARTLGATSGTNPARSSEEGKTNNK